MRSSAQPATGSFCHHRDGVAEEISPLAAKEPNVSSKKNSHFLGVSAPFFRQDQLWLAGPGSYSLVRLPNGTISSRVSLSGDYQGVNQSSFRKVVLLRASASNRAARVVLFFLLGSLPAFFLFGSIWRTAVNVPFMDDWQFVSLLERFSRTAREFSSTSAC
jgi:hypothetical protein